MHVVRCRINISEARDVAIRISSVMDQSPTHSAVLMLGLINSLVVTVNDRNDIRLTSLTLQQQRFLDTFISDPRAFFYFCVAGISKDVERDFSCNDHQLDKKWFFLHDDRSL